MLSAVLSAVPFARRRAEEPAPPPTHFPASPQESGSGVEVDAMDVCVQSSDDAPIFNLPAELLHHILSYLSPFDLASVSQTCRSLHRAATDDQLWATLLFENLPHIPPTLQKQNKTGTGPSFREIYTGLHPYWFLPRHALWFSNTAHTGKLLLARYSARRHCIEAYVLTAIREVHHFSTWSNNPEVIIHSFQPHIQLVVDQPAVKLTPRSNDEPTKRSSDLRNGPLMDVGHNSMNSPRLHSRFVLCKPLPAEAIRPGTQTWPPQHLPAYSRCHAESASSFLSSGHAPSSQAEISQHNFRIKQTLNFGSLGGGINLLAQDHDPVTYATLPKEAYTPTRTKPWRGIWVGDYSGHGCEFLAVLQPDRGEEGKLPEGLRGMVGSAGEVLTPEEQWIHAHHQAFAPHMPGMIPDDAWSVSSDSDDLSIADEDENDDMAPAPAEADRMAWDATEIPEEAYDGRIEAIKLTGDVNIPRGEYTFIAPDIGQRGLVRVSSEEPFTGARVVKSFGHIAARGFRHDGYTPSQLILISPNRLAQYWEAFGHISYYERVDIEKFLEGDF